MLAPKCLKLCNLIKHTPYFNTICLKLVLNKKSLGLFITNHLKSENTSGVKKTLLGVPNEAVLLRITKVHLNIKRSSHLQTFPNCKLFLIHPLEHEEAISRLLTQVFLSN